MAPNKTINIININGKLMYDFKNTFINSLMKSKDCPDFIVIDDNTFLITREIEGYKKGEVFTEKLIEEDNSSTLVNYNNNKKILRNKEYFKKENKLDNLIVLAEKIISKPNNKFKVIEHIKKMENNIKLANQLDYYNLSAYYIELANLKYIMHDEFNKELSPLCEKYFLEALTINKDSQNARIGLILYYFSSYNKEFALEYIKEIKNKNKRDVFLDYYESSDEYTKILNLAKEKKHKGDYINSKEWIIEAIKKDPHRPDAYYNLGKILYILEEYEQAVSSYRKAIEFEWDKMEALRHMGYALMANESREIYKIMLDKYRKTIDPFYKLPNSYSEIGDSEYIDFSEKSMQKSIDYMNQ